MAANRQSLGSLSTCARRDLDPLGRSRLAAMPPIKRLTKPATAKRRTVFCFGSSARAFFIGGGEGRRFWLANHLIKPKRLECLGRLAAQRLNPMGFASWG